MSSRRICCCNCLPIYTVDTGLGGTQQGFRADSDDGTQFVSEWAVETTNQGRACEGLGCSIAFFSWPNASAAGRIRRVNRKTGATVWTQDTLGANDVTATSIHASGDFVWYSTQTLDGANYRCRFVKLNVADGSTEWTYDVPGGANEAAGEDGDSNGFFYIDPSDDSLWFQRWISINNAGTLEYYIYLESLDADGNIDTSVEIWNAMTDTAARSIGTVAGEGLVPAGNDFILRGVRDAGVNGENKRITRAGSLVWAAGASVDIPHFSLGNHFYSIGAGVQPRQRLLSDGSSVAFTTLTGITGNYLAPAPDGDVYIAGSGTNEIRRVKIGTGQVWTDNRTAGSVAGLVTKGHHAF